MDSASGTKGEEELVYNDLLEQRTQEIVEALEILEKENESEAPDTAVADESRQAVIDLMSKLYEADLADLFEVLRPSLRDIAAAYLPDHRLARVVNDMNDIAGTALVRFISDEKLSRALKACDDMEEIEGLLRVLAPKRRSTMLLATGLSNNVALLHSLSFAKDTVGELMDFQHICVDDNDTVSKILETLRNRKSLPPQCDKLFAINKGKLVGLVPLKRLIVNPPETKVGKLMVSERLHTLLSTDPIEEAVDLFERYDLVSAPVLNQFGEVMGRVTVDEILAHAREDRHTNLLNATGLGEGEDLYAPTLRKLQNRGTWIFVNLVAAFLVSRVIGAFEETIIQVVALASLMPIVASMAGNTGMQTATIVIRSLALNQINTRNWYLLLGNELLLGLVNGLLWGSMVGMFSLLFYGNVLLAAVLSVSMTVVFLLAAALGFLVPVTVQAMRGDPALGTSVIVTLTLDCLGFFIFLSLAAGFLV